MSDEEITDHPLFDMATERRQLQRYGIAKAVMASFAASQNRNYYTDGAGYYAMAAVQWADALIKELEKK